MESTSFASTRTDAFPAGLRVLVVDDDLTWLKILEKMLKKCSYEVTACGLARKALDLLRERKEGFDIVISDVNMPDMDGFKLLEHVGLEMDLPVIMMSVDGETSRVMKGVQHGACDYLLKPIRMKELRNIWQHVLRKRIHEVRDTDSLNGLEEIQMMSNGLDHADDAYLLSATDLSSGRKRKDTENKHDDREHSDTSSVKKPRVVWTVDLHQKFVKAVNQIGLDKAGPKKILDLMGVQWLTRENVASHLQKYRLYLSRLQKENELKASFGSARPSDLPPRDPSGNACPPNHLNTQQNDVTSGKCDISGKKNLMQNADSKVHEGGMKGNVSIPIAETTKAPSGDTPYSKKTSSSKMGLNNSFRAPDSDATYAASTHMQHSWTSEYPQIWFKQEHNADFRLVNKHNHLPLPRPKHCDRMQPSSSFTSRPSSSIGDELANTELKPSYVKSRSLSIGEVLQAESVVDLFPINLTNCHSFEPIPSPTWRIKNTGSDQVLLNDMESAQRNLFLGSGTALGSLDKDLLSYSLHGDFQPINIGLASAESLHYIDPELFAAITPSVYQPLRFDYEYPAIDQSLFIV